MPIRYVGRESFFRGKSLFEIAANLKNCGEGRVVTRWKFSERYEEPSYYRLTKIVPDLSNKLHDQGEAWGMKVFRGENFGEHRIGAGQKTDWRLIPKDEEAAFCQEVCEPRPKKVIPKFLPVPPLLELLTKQDMRARGEDISDISPSLKMSTKIAKSFLNHAVLDES